MTEKLQVAMLINLIGSHHSKIALNGNSIEEFAAYRYWQKLNYIRIDLIKLIFRQTDVVIGGLPQYTFDNQYLNSSLSYCSDDYTWCVQAAKYLPLPISFFRIMTPAVWVLVIGLGYVNGLVIYFFVQMDPDPENRRLDLNHTTYLISLPAWIGLSQRFYPKHWPLRLYYMITLMYGMIFFAIVLSFVSEFGEKRIRAYQIHTIGEFIDMGFRLAGSATILKKIQMQEMVSIL